MKNQILKFGTLFLIIYISFIALGYLLARGNFVNPLAAKFFVKDMIILSLFCLVAAEFWLERTKFLLFFGIIFFNDFTALYAEIFSRLFRHYVARSKREFCRFQLFCIYFNCDFKFYKI